MIKLTVKDMETKKAEVNVYIRFKGVTKENGEQVFKTVGTLRQHKWSDLPVLN